MLVGKPRLGAICHSRSWTLSWWRTSWATLCAAPRRWVRCSTASLIRLPRRPSAMLSWMPCRRCSRSSRVRSTSVSALVWSRLRSQSRLRSPSSRSARRRSAWQRQLSLQLRLRLSQQRVLCAAIRSWTMSRRHSLRPVHCRGIWLVPSRASPLAQTSSTSTSSRISTRRRSSRMVTIRRSRASVMATTVRGCDRRV